MGINIVQISVGYAFQNLIIEITEKKFSNFSNLIQTIAQRLEIAPGLSSEQASGLLKLLIFSIIAVIQALAQRSEIPPHMTC